MRCVWYLAVVVLVALAVPAQAAYTFGVCQADHTPTTQWADVADGDCKDGDPQGLEPDLSYQLCGDGSHYWYSSWERTLVNVVHNSSCVGIYCSPCNIINGDCPVRPIISVQQRHHILRWPNLVLVYDHYWSASITRACNCARHG